MSECLQLIHFSEGYGWSNKAIAVPVFATSHFIFFHKMKKNF